MDFDEQPSDGPGAVLRVKRKRTTPSAPGLVVEGLVPRAAKRQAILDHFSQLGLAGAPKPDFAATPAIFQLVTSSASQDDMLGEHMVQDSLLHRRAANKPPGSAGPAAFGVTYQHIVEDQERDSLSKLFQIYTIAAELGDADSRQIVDRPTAEQCAVQDSNPSIAEALSTDEVYDYYMLSTDDQSSADWDLHVSRLPMVKIKDDLWVVDEDEVNADHDSEDSNAESFYANSYPEDEDESSEDSIKRQRLEDGFDSNARSDRQDSELNSENEDVNHDHFHEDELDYRDDGDVW